jgi:probable HAF family extracellular repeat protein
MRPSLRYARPQLEALEDRWLPSYSVLDLGGLTPAALNGADQVAGSVNNVGSLEPFPHGQAALWQSGTTLALSIAYSAAYDLNDAGQVVGTASVPGYTAFVWDRAGGMTFLGGVSGATAAYGINASGQAVGTSGLNTYAPHSVLWDTTAHSVRDLGTLGGYP